MTFTTRNHQSALFRLAVVAAVFGIAGCQHRVAPAPLIGGVTVSGRVLDGGGNAGLGGVEVGLYSGNAERFATPVMSGATNGSGYFSISSVEPGYYLLRAVKGGYRELNQRLQVPAGRLPALVIRLFQGSTGCVSSATPHTAFASCP